MTNRAQRRAQKHHKAKPPGVSSAPVQFQHGHSDTHVVVVFSRELVNMTLTPAECEAFINAMQQSKTALMAHLEKKGG